VLLSARAFRRGGEAARRPLTEAGCELLQIPGFRPLTEAELREWIGECDGIIAGNDPFTPEVFALAPRLKVIARWGIGVDAIDLDAATQHGVVVTNTPGLITDSVADFTFGCMIALARHLIVADRMVRAGGWDEVRGVNVWRKCLGIVGFGHIGQAVARRARGFEMEVLAYDIQPNHAAAAELGVTFVPLEELLERADFVSLHVSLTPATRGLIDAAALRRMKPTTCLINTGRGGLVDEAALWEALRRGEIAGAALDVFNQEPLPPDHPFVTLDNVILSPHSAFNTVETQDLVNRAVAESVLDVLQGRRPRNVVNLEVYERT
jgi:D-3-phosphoglycerate dehydrogenase